MGKLQTLFIGAAAVAASAAVMRAGYDGAYGDLRDEHRVNKKATNKRLVKRLAAKWLAKYRQPRMIDHPFVWKLFTEMGEHPLDREYYAIAHRRLGRWFSELPTFESKVEGMAKDLVGDVPDDELLMADWLNRLEFEKERLLLEFESNPHEFYLYGREHRWEILQPPTAFTYRYSCQIIEAAIAMRVTDLEESQNILRSVDVREAGTDTVSWRTAFHTWRTGLTSWFTTKPPSTGPGIQ